MEKTARRRRIQHWLLLVLRALLLALLALGVAEPVSQAVGGWLAGNRSAAVIVLDNSLSMAARRDSSSRLAQARTESAALLGGEDKPALAALMTTNGGFVSRDLTSQLETLREGVGRADVGYGVAPIGPRVTAAVEMLQKESAPRKAIYVFSDLQRVSFEDLLALPALAQAKDIHLLLVNTGAREVNNVGISDLEITGQRVVDSVLEFTATLVNSSPTDRVVDVGMRVEGTELRQRIRKTLKAAGQEGSSAAVRFLHRFSQSGPATGEVFLDTSDDLPVDNLRRFSLTIGKRVGALVVRGPAAASS
jgi:hypothetical protein